MEEANIVLKNAYVLTMNEQLHQYNPGAVAISGDTILAVGPESDILSRYQAAEVIDCEGKVVMPGLINAHTHVPMTLLRGLADDLRLDVWLMGYMMPVEREFVSPDFVKLGTRLACAEMLRAGITTFCDMYYFEDDIAQATAEIGMRAICSQTVLKFPTPDALSYEESLAAARSFIEKWKGHHLIVPSVAPHAPYTCTVEILKACAALAAEFDVPLHTHLAETALEVENIRNETGMPVIPYVRKQNLFDAKVIAAHCVHIDEGEIRTLVNVGAGVAHNPTSNLKLASGFAPIKRMMELGLNVGIGTDGPASNNDLDMFEEIRLAALLAKGVSGDPVALPARTTLLMATRIGAQALHIGNITGSLEAGKRADLILIDMNPLHNTPQFERDSHGIYAQIVYAAKSTDVTDVMVNGRFLMRKRALSSIDEAEVTLHSQEYARKIDRFLILREKSVISKLIAIGGAMEEESFEIQHKVQINNSEEILSRLLIPEIEITRKRHYREYDTYFGFEEQEQDVIRFREDHFIGDEGEVTHVRSRLTLIGGLNETQPLEKVVLSRSRYYAPATQGLRFYREYFKPVKEFEIEKDRLRFLVNFQNTELFVNIDQVTKPTLGMFLEIKSRTWGRQDAANKAKIVLSLLNILGISPEEPISKDYIHLIKK